MRKINFCWSLFLLFAVSISWASSEIDIKDEFADFDTRPSNVAIEDNLAAAPWTLWQTGAARVVCQDGLLKLELSNAGELRVVCKEALDSSQKGTIEVKVRFQGLGNGNVFLGAASKDPWMKYGVTQRFNNSRTGHFVTLDTPPIQSDEWHVFHLEWEGGSASVSMDGEPQGKVKYEPHPNGFFPLMVINSRGKAWTAEIDYFRFAGNRPIRPVASAQEEDVPVPVPVLPPTLPEPAPKAASIALDANRLVLENRYFRQEFAWDDGKPIRCTSFVNAYTGKNMLLQPARFFSVFQGTRQLDDFLVAEASVQGKQVKLVLRSTAAPVEAVWTAWLEDDSPELRTTLALKNLSDKKTDLGAAYPLLLGLKIGDRLEDNNFFFPFETGLAGALDCRLGHVYGVSAFLQVMTGFSPLTGGSVYAYPADASGNLKLLSLRSQSTDKTPDVAYEPIAAEDPLRTGKLLDGQKGLSLSWRFPVMPVEPGASLALPETVVGVGASDWRDGLRSYGKFVRSWWHKQVKTPQWYQQCFGSLSGHPNSNIHLLSPKPKDCHGYYNFTKGKYDYSNLMGEWERDSIMEIAFWWEYSEENYKKTTSEMGQLGQPFSQAYQIGNYTPNSHRGGTAALRQEIADIHAKGGRLMLYTFPESSSRGSEIDKLTDGDKLGMRYADGELNTNYVGKGNGWFLCYYEPEFAKVVAKRIAQTVRETGADGVRLDTMARLYTCHSQYHAHNAGGTLYDTASPELLAKTLITFKDEIGKANPAAAVSTEHAGCEYLTQFLDGFYSQGIHWLSPKGRWGNYRPLNTYQMVFSRFILPEGKVWIHSHFDKYEAGRMSIFNGVGDCCTETQEVLAFKTLQENSDTFGSNDLPEPLVPTLQESVFCNRFTGAKEIHSLYNRGEKPVSGPVLSLPAQADKHYVDVYRDVEATVVKTKDGRSIVSLDLPANEVAALATFPKLLECSVEGNILTVNLSSAAEPLKLGLVVGDDDFRQSPKELVVTQGKSVSAQVPVDWRKLIVKAFCGNSLVDECVLVK